MEDTPRNLPVGIQDFESVRTGDFLYVDKAALVYDLAKVKRSYFLSRPRCFGKSVLVSTLNSNLVSTLNINKKFAVVVWVA
jgi:hypothetical protein